MVFQTPEDACDEISRTFSSGKTETRFREHFGLTLIPKFETKMTRIYSENDFLSNVENLF